MKASGISKLTAFNYSNGSTTGTIQATVDLAAGTIVQTNPLVSAAIRPVGGGWYNVIFTVTRANSAIGIQWGFTMLDATGNSTFAGNGIDGVLIGHMQTEVGTRASSPIRTTTGAVSRGAGTYNMRSYAGATAALVTYNDGTTANMAVTANNGGAIPVATSSWPSKYITNITYNVNANLKYEALCPQIQGSINNPEGYSLYLKSNGAPKVRVKIYYIDAATSPDTKYAGAVVSFDSNGNITGFVIDKTQENSSGGVSCTFDYYQFTAKNGDIWWVCTIKPTKYNPNTQWTSYRPAVGMLDANGNEAFQGNQNTSVSVLGFSNIGTVDVTYPRQIGGIPYPATTLNNTTPYLVAQAFGSQVTLQYYDGTSATSTSIKYIPPVGDSIDVSVTGGLFPDGYVTHIADGDAVKTKFEFVAPQFRNPAIGRMDYYIGANVNLSELTVSYLADRKNGLLPTCGGVPYTVTKDK